MMAQAIAYQPFVGRCVRCGRPVTRRWDEETRTWRTDLHDAPCGLPCRTPGQYFAHTHQGTGRCPRCPVPAPRRRSTGARRRRMGARR
jgi:hypothetical protein